MSDEQNNILGIKDFQSTDSVSKGFSGSEKVQKDDIFYQLKKSALEKLGLQKLKARVKGNGLFRKATDHENIAEFISAKIASNIKDTTLASPDIYLVKEDGEKAKDKGGITIASKFINNFQDLATFFGKQNPKLIEGKNIRYVRVNFDSNKSNILREKKTRGKVNCSVELGALELDEQVKKGISDGIAINALFGNADVNAAGNMGIQKADKGPSNAAILDFGHAFNNLISGTKKFGGGVKGKNGILDFINRDKVLNFPNGSPSKLWRDYKGLIESEIFANSLDKIGSKAEQVGTAIANAKAQLLEFAESLGENDSTLRASLKKLNKNIGASYQKGANTKELIETSFSNLEEFCQKRCEEMKEVAKTINLQIAINNHLKTAPDKVLPRELKEQFKNLTTDGKLSWVKSDAKEKPKICSLEEYVNFRKEKKQERTKASAKKLSSRIFGKWTKKIILRRNSTTRSTTQNKNI